MSVPSPQPSPLGLTFSISSGAQRRPLHAVVRPPRYLAPHGGM